MVILMYLQFVCEAFYLIFYTFWILLVKVVQFLVPQELKSLAGEIILITGGGKGIGREICNELIKTERDITLIIWGTDEVNGNAVANDLKESGIKAVHWFTVDVGDREQVERGAKKIRDEIGQVTMLINNAGIPGPVGPSWKMDPKAVERLTQVNYLSNCWTIQEFLPPMIQRGKGHVVVTNSIVGCCTSRGWAPYIAAKHAIKAYIECVKEDVRHLPKKPKIHFTVTFPHNTHTPISSAIKVYCSKYPFMVPSLTPKEVAARTVIGILRNEENIFIPRVFSTTPLIWNSFPAEVIRKSNDLAGVDVDVPFE